MCEISLVLCTRNRERQLPATLESLRGLKFDGRWELVLVDNGSTDGTPGLLREFARSSEAEIQVVAEPAAGLSRARNRGLSQARGRVVAFTDDDCYPAADYLASLQRCFASEAVDFCGGRLLLYDPADLKVTTQELNERVDLPPHSFIRSGLIHGANMAFRRDALIGQKGFDERLGAGTPCRSGEDTDILRRCLAAGMRGVYDPRIVVYHHHGRKTVASEQSLLRSYARGRGACLAKHLVKADDKFDYLRRWYWQIRHRDKEIKRIEIWWALRFLFIHGPTPNRIWDHPHDSLRKS